LPIVQYFLLIAMGIFAGALITVQSVLNSTLGQWAGYLGAVLILTLVSIGVLAVLILLFPGMANLRQLPGFSQWYLYLGGLLGVAILAAPIFLIPRIGTTATLTALVLGQLLVALGVDHFGMFAAPRIEVGLGRVIGVILVVLGAFLVGR
jgi:transporter family-2 protein